MLGILLGSFFTNYVEARTNQVLGFDNNEGESSIKEVFESGVLVFRSPELELVWGGSNSLPGQGLWLGGVEGCDSTRNNRDVILRRDHVCLERDVVKP